MNKKLAVLLFALGFGAASAPAIATSCEGYCNLAYVACKNAGNDPYECAVIKADCFDNCAFQG